MIDIQDDNLNQLLQEHPRVIVQYGASWCGNCRIIKPKFKKLAEENQGIVFAYVDAEKSPLSRQFADVSNLPTFAAFKDGNLVNQKQGNKAELIQELIHEVTSD